MPEDARAALWIAMVSLLSAAAGALLAWMWLRGRAPAADGSSPDDTADRDHALAAAALPRETLVLDSSVLIDGRILDALRLAEDPRCVLVPAVVVEEVEHLARSNESGRARRGALGREHLAALRTAASQLRGGLTVEDASAVPPDAGLHHPGGVDTALLALCGAAPHRTLVTLDNELAARATAAGILVVDLHKLAASLALRYRVGDTLQVTVGEPGREPGQGLGTLDDGTRVVIADAASHLGVRLSVRITSISKTRGGKVLFAEPLDPPTI